MSVGVITATSGYFSGILTATNLNYDNVTDIYSTGIVTATKGIQITTLGLNVASGIATLTDGLRVGSAATIYSNGNATFSGIVTATSFTGDGTGLTGVASTDNIQTGTPATFLSNVNITGVATATGGLNVGTAATIYANGNIAAAGIVTANGGFVGGLTGNVTGNATGLSGTPNITIGDLVGASLDISGNADIDGTLEADAITVDGTALNEYIADTIGGMVTSNTESGITVAYQDADNTLDFTVGTLNQDTTGNAATATALETARNIGGVSFDGSANINLPGVNESGNQNTSGTAAGLSGTPNITVGDVVAASLDISGNADIDGTLEADAITVNGTALDTHIAGVTVTNATNAAGLTGTPDITVDEVTARNLNISGFTTITSTDTGSSAGPIVELYRNSSSPADADYLGQIKFQGENDNDEKINYAKITGKISDASDGSEDGIIEFAHIKAGSQNISGRWNSTTLQLLNGTDLSVAGDIDLAGDIDVDGTLEADAITVNGTALDTHIAGVTVTTATNATNFACSANNSTDETVYPVFVDGATGNQGAETDTGLSYNPNSGTLTAAVFSGSGASLTNIPGVASESDTAVSSTSATTVATLSASTYRAAIIDVLITQGSAYQAGQYGLIHDGTTATIVEQWAIATGDMLGTFTTTISGGNMLLQVNMGSSSSATVTVKSSTLTV